MDVVALLQRLATSEFERVQAGFSPGAARNRVSLGTPGDLCGSRSDSVLMCATSEAINADPRLESLAKREGELDAFVATNFGGTRVTSTGIMRAIVVTAFERMAMELTEPSLSRLLLQVDSTYNDLVRAIVDGRIVVPQMVGLSGIAIPEGVQVSTPWGVLRPRPPRAHLWDSSPNSRWLNASACLHRTLKLDFSISREPEPTITPPARIDAAEARDIDKLLAAAVAFATEGSIAGRCMPVPVFTVTPIPFDEHTIPRPLAAADSRRLNTLISRDVAALISSWADRVHDGYAREVDVAMSRLLGGVTRRDMAMDRLVDAVIAWENLVGTSNETSFRVTAALAKLLEPDASRRKALRKSLTVQYGLRSKVVHGEVVPSDKLEEAADRALTVGVLALRELYRRGGGWLSMSSTDRSDRLLLEEY